MPRRNKPAERQARQPARAPPESALPAERHSGEGAASVLESLRKMESHRRDLAGPPPDSAAEDDTKRSR